MGTWSLKDPVSGATLKISKHSLSILKKLGSKKSSTSLVAYIMFDTVEEVINVGKYGITILKWLVLFSDNFFINQSCFNFKNNINLRKFL